MVKHLSKAFARKWISAFCTVILLVTAVVLPLSLMAGAESMTVGDNETVTFTFAEGEGTYTNGLAEDDIGYASWALGRSPEDGGMIRMRYTNNARWLEQGGLRLNQGGKFYDLTPNTTYTMSLRLRVKSAPATRSDVLDDNRTASLKIGYGFKANKSTDDNPINQMNRSLFRVLTAQYEAQEFAAEDSFGSYNFPVGDEWHTLTYVFRTPGDLGGGSPALGFYGERFYGTWVDIDDVTVTKLSADTGAVIVRDDYSGKNKVLTGKIGETVILPTAEEMAESAKEESHTFQGWYTDEARKKPAENLTFAAEQKTVYGAWNAEVKIEFINTLDNSVYTTVSGRPGETVAMPKDLEDTETQWFGGWYTTPGYTQKYTDTTFGYNNIQLYSRYVDKQEATKWVYTLDEYDLPLKSGSGFLRSAASDPVKEGENGIIRLSGDAYFSVAHKLNDSCVLDGSSTYMVQFRYRINKSNGKAFTVSPILANPNNRWNAHAVLPVGFTGEADSKTGEWLTATLFVDSTLNKGGKGLFLQLNGLADAEIDIDDITVMNITFNQGIVTLDMGDGLAPVVYVGDSGTDIPVISGDKPTREGYDFLGFYLDSKGKDPFTKTKYERGMNVKVYALWDQNIPEVYTFKNYSLGNYADTGKYHLLNTVWTVDDSATDGRVMRVDGSAADGGYMAVADGSEICRLDGKSAYIVTVKYRMNQTGEGNWKLGAILAGPGGSWDARKVQSAVNSVPKNTPSGTWKETVLILDSSENAGSTCLYLKFDGIKGVSFDIDTVTVQKLSRREGVAIIDLQNGAETVLQRGNAGDAIVFPSVPDRTGYTFLGWFSDSKGEKPLTTSVLPVGAVQKIYACWSKAETIVYDFEKPYPFGNFSDTGKYDTLNSAQKVTSQARSGDKVMASAGSGYFAVASGSDKCVLNKKSIYVVDVHYLVKSNSSPVTVSAILAGKDGSWSERRVMDSSFKIAASAATDTWLSGRLILDSKAASSQYLYLKLDGLDGEIYFDDIEVTEIPAEKGCVVFEPLNGDTPTLRVGNDGEAITYPTDPTKFDANFTAWFTDKETTNRFTDAVFTAGKSLVVYAGWAKKDEITYDFENYDCQVYKSGVYEKFHMLNSAQLQTSDARSGSHVITTTGDMAERAIFAVADGTIPFAFDGQSSYIVSFHYFVKKAGLTNASVQVKLGQYDNHYATPVLLTNSWSIAKWAEEGVWYTGVLAVDSSLAIKMAATSLYLQVNGGSGATFYFDDVTIKKVPSGYGLVVFDNVNNAAGVPSYITGPIGSSFRSRLPETPVKEGYTFVGYFYKDGNGEYQLLTDYTVPEKPLTVYVRLFRNVTFQGFEQDFKDYYDSYREYSCMDFDYEFYDGQAPGNDPSNVTEGRYSLHRKGNSAFFENALVLTTDKALSETSRYTVTMKVKMGKHFQTDGAVKIVSNRNFDYAWTTTGDYYPVVAIADLTDGQWHTVSYTFNSVEPYVSIQTPGYCELFIDEVTFTLVDDNTPLSNPVSFKEYVPALRDEDGELIHADAADVDISSIVFPSMQRQPGGAAGFSWWMILMIGGGAALVIAAGAVTLVLVRKKHRKV